MPEAVWRYVFMDPCTTSSFFHYLPESESGHAFSSVADKKSVAPSSLHDQRARGVQVAAQGFPGGDSKRNKSFFISLAGDSNKRGGEIDAGERQGDQFGDAHSSGVKQLQHGVVTLDEWAAYCGWAEKSVHLFKG